MIHRHSIDRKGVRVGRSPGGADPRREVEIRILRSLVMGPHADDLYRPGIIKYLVDQPMLNVNAAGAGACQITDKFFEWGR